MTDMVWDNKGQQLFIGDSNGKISTSHMPGVVSYLTITRLYKFINNVIT